MKTIINWTAVLFLSMWFMACSSTTAPNETVEKAFTKKFGNVESVKWTHNADYSYAHFTQDGKAVVAVFGNDGQYIETDAAKPVN
ncbi:hypothetical protein WBJ53_09735 [Spirosoma sp. SC4-14]|uniref:hypothetical protein n=1 Tax=Spirosoma sp. SC4-14 TaxID=3128900 RepID=UPI0030CAFCB6